MAGWPSLRYTAILVAMQPMIAPWLLVGVLTALAVAALVVLVNRRGNAHLAQKNAPLSRIELMALINRAAENGIITVDDARLVGNALRFHEIKVEDVMTPRTVVAMMPADATLDTLIKDERCRIFSRILVYEGSRDRVVGYVLQREVLSAVVRGLDRNLPISRFQRKVTILPEGLSVDRALRRLIETREHLVLVCDEFGGLAGLVTLEDLMETLLGIEILDESDRVADLRTEAAQLRERRLREQKRRDELEDAAERERVARAAANNP